MAVQVTEVQVKSVLTRTSGFLKTVSSHSLQPYRGCTFGKALCGVGCYVQHNAILTRHQPWGSFLEVRTNAAEVYRRQFSGERKWARNHRGEFCIFMSSSTDPFLPQEDRYRITLQILEAMVEFPPDTLIIQSHTHRVTRYLDEYLSLNRRAALRIHISIESDLSRLPGLPPPASSIDSRLQAAAELKSAGLRVVVTVAPLLPIQDPERFFERISQVADAVVLDHFIEGDGSSNGSRTSKTALPGAMSTLDPHSTSLDYRDRMLAIAQGIMPGRVGLSVDGFAGRFFEDCACR